MLVRSYAIDYIDAVRSLYNLWLRHVLCREAGDECYMQSIWHEILTYLTPDLPRAWYRKCQLTAQNIFVNIIFVMIM